MEYRHYSAEAQQKHDGHHSNGTDFDLVPPTWWNEIAPPPYGDLADDDDAFESEWLATLDDDGSAPKYYSTDQVELVGDKPPVGILWQGRVWSVGAKGVSRRDGSHTIPFDKLWTTSAIRQALAVAGDLADFKEALRLGRRLDCYFDAVDMS